MNEVVVAFGLVVLIFVVLGLEVLNSFEVLVLNSFDLEVVLHNFDLEVVLHRIEVKA